MFLIEIEIFNEECEIIFGMCVCVIVFKFILKDVIVVLCDVFLEGVMCCEVMVLKGCDGDIGKVEFCVV